MIAPKVSSVLLWAVLVQTAFLTLTPYVQTLSGDPVGWRENIPLLVAFSIIPLTAGYLVKYGKERFGAILLLSCLPAAVFANAQFLYISIDILLLPDASAFWHVAYQFLLIMVMIIQLGGSILSAIVLRNIHRDISSSSSS